MKNEHDIYRMLTGFQHWLGSNFCSLPVDSGTMTNRAREYMKENPDLKLKLLGVHDVIVLLVCDDKELDCPYDFTSRCTMGRCDCKPED